LRAIIFILLLLSLYFGICIFVGVKLALVAFSLLMLTLATVFIIKRDSYVKYIEFVNPKYALLYNSKDDDFRGKHRITDIIGFYIISAIMLFISVNVPNTPFPIQGNSVVYLIIATVLSTILLWCFSLLILKKSKKNSSFWFYFIALILFAILVLTIIQIFIF
jgi:hypothetical protein